MKICLIADPINVHNITKDFSIKVSIVKRYLIKCTQLSMIWCALLLYYFADNHCTIFSSKKIYSYFFRHFFRFSNYTCHRYLYSNFVQAQMTARKYFVFWVLRVAPRVSVQLHTCLRIQMRFSMPSAPKCRCSLLNITFNTRTTLNKKNTVVVFITNEIAYSDMCFIVSIQAA